MITVTNYGQIPGFVEVKIRGLGINTRTLNAFDSLNVQDCEKIISYSSHLVLKDSNDVSSNIVPDQLGMFTPDEIRLARKDNKMLSLWINLSNLCNLRCRYCFNAAGKALSGELKLYEILRMMSEFKLLGGKKIVIVGSGEPTIDPNFELIIFNAYTLGLETVLFTNGLRIADEPKLVNYLWENDVSIALKFHSFDKKVQDFLIGRNVSEKIYKAIDIILNSEYKDSNRFSLANQVFKQNLADLPDTYRYCRDNGIIPRVSKILFKGKGKTCQDLYPEDYEVKDLYAELKRIDKEEYGLEWGRFTNNVYAGDQGCQLLYVNLFVDPLGEVQSCIGIMESLGNIKNVSLAEMWEKNTYKDIDAKLIGPCAKCKTHIQNRCYSCAGRNHLACGNAFQSTPCANMERMSL